jgi:DNA-binding NtrC family response regulator
MFDFNSIPNGARREAVELLYHFLKNPGRFSILVLGKPGVGKSHWIRHFQPDLKGEVSCTQSICEVSLRTVAPNQDAWLEIFRQANGGILIVKELEQVKSHDALLFEALSTTDGTFGFSADERFEIRVVFTSSYGIDSLRKTEDLISHRLFDRVAQLVVEFPSLRETNLGIWEDFQASWNKMKFTEKNDLPGNSLKIWLENERKDFLHGNFRDLDKIAILWHQFRLMEVEESQILKQVCEQLLRFSAYPEQRTELGDAFYFQEGKTGKDLITEFKASLKKWAVEVHGTARKAEKALGMGNRTLEKW